MRCSFSPASQFLVAFLTLIWVSPDVRAPLKQTVNHPMPVKRFQTTISLLYYVFGVYNIIRSSAFVGLRPPRVVFIKIDKYYYIMVKAAFRMVRLPRVVILFLKRDLKNLKSIDFRSLKTRLYCIHCFNCMSHRCKYRERLSIRSSSKFFPTPVGKMSGPLFLIVNHIHSYTKNCCGYFEMY